MIFSLFLVLLLYTYWYGCRQLSLTEKETLADITIEYLDDESTHTSMKDMAYLSYRVSDKWWLFPALCILSPFFILTAKSKDIEKADSLASDSGNAKLQKLVNSACSVNMKRNPIFSFIFSIIYVLVIILSLLISIAFGKLKRIPNIRSIALYSIHSIDSLSKKSRA